MLGHPTKYNSFYDRYCGEEMPPGMIFVFGSNLAGRHGKGAALEALSYGAQYGRGIGRVGNSYGIPTKDRNLNVLPIHVISRYVDDFRQHTLSGDYFYYVTQIGCGLAGYKPHQIAPLFKGCQNCYFSYDWFSYVV